MHDSRVTLQWRRRPKWSTVLRSRLGHETRSAKPWVSAPETLAAGQGSRVTPASTLNPLRNVVCAPEF
jgi:hypothetical protein